MSRTVRVLVPVLFVFALTVLPTTAAAQAAATPPAAPQPQTAARLFPPDSKVAFVDLQRIFSESAFGKSGMAKVTALQTTLNTGLQVRAKDIQALSEKIKSQQGVVEETTWLTWNTDLLRLQREAQFAQQEAEIQVQQFQQSLLASFEKVVQPVIDKVRQEKGLWFVFAMNPAAETSGLSVVAADPSLDLSGEILKKLTDTRQ